MKEAGKTISFEDYLRLKEFVDGKSPQGKGLTRDGDLSGEVISIQSYQEKVGQEVAARDKAKARAGETLRAIVGLIRDYEAQMLIIANGRDLSQWQEEIEQDPYEQIQFDIKRLKDWVDALDFAMEVKGAYTLGEACDELQSWASDEVKATLEYIGKSPYFGFQAIIQLLQAGKLCGEDYLENHQVIGEIYRQAREERLVFSIGPLSSLCFDEALPV